jgi:hypothetical protein
MKVRTPKATSIAASIAMGTLVACGSVGSPVPPETVGVTPTIERQKKTEALEQKQRVKPPLLNRPNRNRTRCYRGRMSTFPHCSRWEFGNVEIATNWTSAA